MGGKGKKGTVINIYTGKKRKRFRVREKGRPSLEREGAVNFAGGEKRRTLSKGS